MTANRKKNQQKHVLEGYALAKIDPDTLPALIRENIGALGVSEFDLDRVTVPAGGGTRFDVPTLDGVEGVDDLDGVVVAFRDGRSYWAETIDEGGGTAPPDCTSEDAITGVGSPGGDCRACPLAQFGSAGNKRAQACKQVRLLFLIRADALLPIVVSIPPTSLGSCRKYFLRLASRGVPYFGVITRIGLEAIKNADGVRYSVARFSMAAMLSEEEVTRCRAISQALAPQLQAVRVHEGGASAPEKR